MDSADQSDPINRKDSHKGQQQRLPCDNDSKEGASSRLQSEDQQVSALNESIAALLQGSSQAEAFDCIHAALDIDLEIFRVMKCRDADSLDLYILRNKFLMHQENVDQTRLLQRIGGIAKVKMDYYITLLINNSDEEMQQQVDNDLSSWKNVQIEIAIAGESGSGKSSFINAVLGLTADDEGAAAVGCTETTMEVTKYVHPETQNIAFYDLPGIGTPKFPKDNYIELVNLDKYDFFLLLSQQRFKENDMWFANEIEKRNKKFFFVRTHIHKDMLASKQSHPRSHNRRKVIEEIRENIRKHLLDGGIHLKNVYIALIDNYERQDYDFEELLLKLVEKAPELKKEALIYSLSERSRGIIQMKAKFLKGRMGGIAIYASLFSLMSHENREEVMKLMFHECSLYQQQLGINTASLEIDALQLKVDKDEIVKEIKMSSYTEHDLESIFSKEWKSVPALIKRIPIVCSITCAIRTYTTCVACLKSVLELCEKDALALNAYRLSTGFK
ncbi:T-cell-specific guanine nucleotide triphosphate-binding protein 2-like isoform X2 [Mya arenaria]|uniref:T-cell-specific guanine nucleotide triphosphate-binding protein 2-like isoform X2 n=1 Tax=Mya arenaria TaxID=6604 RepID=UPI0022E452C4|nr:T-cell-specific guanine nucleotide triphosphate-binding protein 2-like isoform X2 [Mya arenaria]